MLGSLGEVRRTLCSFCMVTEWQESISALIGFVFRALSLVISFPRPPAQLSSLKVMGNVNSNRRAPLANFHAPGETIREYMVDRILEKI